MDSKSFVMLVKKYLNGHATIEDHHFLNKYDSKFEVEPTPTLSQLEESQLESELFDRIQHRINIQKNSPAPARNIFLNISRVAASIAILLCIGALLYLNRYNMKEMLYTTEQTKITAGPGQVKKITLADGTRVTLNAGSDLTFPQQFNGNTRTVTLNGEAYFDVAHNAEQPFVVNTTNLKVQVLGTRFNVNAYRGSTSTNVAVVSGRVSVESTGSRKSKTLLTPGQKASYHIADQTMSQEDTDSTEILGWQNGQIIFKNQPLSEVVDVLERKYNVRIDISQQLANCRIYAKITNDQPNAALGAIASLMNAKLETRNGLYRLSGSGCN